MSETGLECPCASVCVAPELHRRIAELEGQEITEEMIDRAAAELERDKFECGLYTSDRELAAGILRAALREGEKWKD